MKKLIFLVIIFVCITGCSKPDTTKSEDIKSDSSKEILNTTKDFGIIEFHNGEEDVNTSLWYDFVKHKVRYKSASITLHRYTMEGDLITYKLEYDNDGYELVVDNRKDNFANEEDRKITKQKYTYLIPITGKALHELCIYSTVEWSIDIEKYTFWFVSKQAFILSYPPVSQDDYQSFIEIKN